MKMTIRNIFGNDLRLKLLLVIFPFILCAKPKPEDVVIRVNDRKITQREFMERLNGLPQVGSITEDDVKKNLTCTLVAESILSFEAAKIKLDTSAGYKMLSNQYSSEALYEQWMDSEIRNQVKVSDEELKAAYKKFREERVVEFWILRNLSEANSLISKLKTGNVPDQHSEYKKIEYGKSLESVEDEVFGLQEGEVSDPVNIDSTFYVFKLVKNSPHPKYSKETFPYWMPSIDKIIRDRKENLMLDVKFSFLMADKEYSIKKSVFNFLLEQLYPAIYSGKELKYKQPEDIQREIFTKDISTGSIYDQPLITFKNGENWTLLEFWKKLSICPFPLNYKNPDDLKQGLQDVIRRIILFESVTNNAKVKNYQGKNFVESQTSMWSNNLLANGLLNNFRSKITVNDDEVVKRYEISKDKVLKPELRKIIPIIVKDKELALRLLKQIKEGADILPLAEKHSLAKVFAGKDDPGVIITQDYWGNTGKAAFRLKPGETSGLVQNDDTSYAIVKLIEIQKERAFKLEEVKDKINVALQDEKLQKDVNEILTQNAKKYKIEINNEAISKIQYLKGNVAVKKIHFPLRNLAPSFQYFDHNAKWYKEIISGE